MVIAGMGGETIRDILRAAPWAADGHHTLLLQPMTKVELLRAGCGKTDTAAPKNVWCRTRENCM